MSIKFQEVVFPRGGQNAERIECSGFRIVVVIGLTLL
jgi:hypothetical protein